MITKKRFKTEPNNKNVVNKLENVGALAQNIIATIIGKDILKPGS